MTDIRDVFQEMSGSLTIFTLYICTHNIFLQICNLSPVKYESIWTFLKKGEDSYLKAKIICANTLTVYMIYNFVFILGYISVY